MSDDLKFNLTLDIQIDLKPIVAGTITQEQVKTELEHFVNDVTKLQKKYDGWLTFISERKGWDTELDQLLREKK